MCLLLHTSCIRHSNGRVHFSEKQLKIEKNLSLPFMLNLLNNSFFLIILTAPQANPARILSDVHLFVFKT